MERINYPTPRRDDSVEEDHFGIKVKDPYRWMEDPDAEETKQFVEAQNAISQPFINGCPDRETINATLTKLWNYPKYGVPHKRVRKLLFFQEK